MSNYPDYAVRRNATPSSGPAGSYPDYAVRRAPVAQNAPSGQSPGRQQEAPLYELLLKEFSRKLERGEEVPGWHAPAHGLNKSFGDLLGGFVQPVLERGYLGDRIKQGSINAAESRENNYNVSLRQHRLKTAGSKLAGDISTDLAIGALTGVPGRWMIPAAGAAGGLTGAAEYVRPGESRAKNAGVRALTSAGGTALTQGAMALLKAAPKAAQFAWNVPLAKDEARLTASVMNHRAVDQGTNREAFSYLKGVGKNVPTSVPTIPFRAPRNASPRQAALAQTKALKNSNADFFENVSKKQAKAVVDYHRNPNASNGIDAYQDLGKIIRDLEGKSSAKTILKAEKDALARAKTMQRDIKNQVIKGFKDAGMQDHGDLFLRSNRNYRERIRHWETSTFENKANNLRTNKDFLDELQNDKTWRAVYGNMHPAVDVRKNLPEVQRKLVKGGLIGGATLLGVGGYNAAKSYGQSRKSSD